MARRRKHSQAQPAAPIEPQQDAQADDNITLDFGAIKDGFAKAGDWLGSWNAQRAVTLVLLALALAITLWIRLQPMALGVTEDWATSSINSNLRAQFTQQVAKDFPNLPPANRDAKVDEQVAAFLEQNQASFDQAHKDLSAQLKSYYQYEAENGKNYTYLGDLDSYFWLRYTRNWLETGTVCDAVTPEGQCRDMFVLAPVGSSTDRNPALHVFAIGIAQMAMTAIDPQFPITATSMYLPVLLALLAVIPAFFIGRKVAGNVGGFFAALLIAVNPMHLSRSMGSDNDGWNVLVPLWSAWFLIEALEAKDRKRAAIYGAVSALFVTLHAAAWSGGWWMPYLIMLFAGIGLLLYRIIRDLVRGTRSPWKDVNIQRAGIALLVFYILTGIGTTLMGLQGYLSTPLRAVYAGGALDQAVAGSYWPNVLTTVAELNKASLGSAIGNFGGPLLFLGALAGMMLLLLPRKGWRFAHYAVFAGGIAVYAYLVNATDVGKFGSLLLLGTPVAAIMLLDLIWGKGQAAEDEAHLGAALIILLWFLVTTYATYSGVRFILLMVAPFGLAFGVLAGRTHSWATRTLSREFPKRAAAVALCVFLVLSLALIAPIKAGYGTARGFVPSIDDAWWASLTKIREETAPDAILNSWWDFGHWFKYVAERRVSADGTTQHTHVPHWLGRALVTPSETESVGILRMLDCGSDAYPGPEGAYGAYGIALEAIDDPIDAHALIADVVKEDRAEARRGLLAAGIDGETAERILEKTHCDAPEDYFITSNDMIGKAGVWAHFGLWDFDRAYAVEQAQTLPQQEAVPAISARLNLTETQARQVYAEIQALRLPDGSWNEGAINSWVAVWPGYLTGGWVGCARTENGTAIDCPGGFGIGQSNGQTIGFDGFRYNITSPQSSRVVLGAYVNGQRVGSQGNATPEAIIVADKKLQKLGFGDPSIAGVSVVIDVPNNRMLVASTPLAESMFTQLYYLDGRYNEVYEKFDDRTGFTGTRVVVWKVNWDAFDEKLAQRDAAVKAR